MPYQSPEERASRAVYEARWLVEMTNKEVRTLRSMEMQGNYNRELDSAKQKTFKPSIDWVKASLNINQRWLALEIYEQREEEIWDKLINKTKVLNRLITSCEEQLAAGKDRTTIRQHFCTALEIVIQDTAAVADEMVEHMWDHPFRTTVIKTFAIIQEARLLGQYRTANSILVRIQTILHDYKLPRPLLLDDGFWRAEFKEACMWMDEDFKEGFNEGASTDDDFFA